MAKLLSLLMTTALLLGLVVVDVSAIPTRDKQAVIEQLNAYGVTVRDHYPSREPASADDYYKLGIAYLFRNMPKTAVEQFREALELDPGHVNSMIGLASGTAQLGDVETALKYSEEALRVAPDNASAHNAVGVLRMTNAGSLKHLHEAEAQFKKAISLNPRFVPSHMNLARLYISMRKPKEAIRQYETVTGIEPGNLAANVGLARAYLSVGRLDEATEEARRAVELSPRNPVSHTILGEIYALKGQLNEALDRFQKATELEPTYAPGYMNTGRVYFLMDLPDRAVEEYRKALSYRPKYGEAYSALGDAYLIKGMRQKAIEEYNNAIGILPVSALVSVPAYNNLAYLYAEEKQDLDRALSLAQKARQLAPEHPDISDTIGWIYYKKGAYDEAVANLKNAVKGSPNNPTIRYHLGAAYYKQDAKEKALAELEKALEINDAFEGVEDAKQLLIELGAR